MYVYYTAKRSLVAGHAVNLLYNLALSPAPSLKRTSKILKEVQESLSGKIETQFYGILVTWMVDLTPIALDTTTFSYVREFLDSTADGTPFQFDPYGTPTLPSTYLTTVLREDNSYEQTRVITKGTGGRGDFIQMSFSVRESAT